MLNDGLQVLMVLSKCVRDAKQLMALKPTKVKNDVAAKFSIEKGTLNVTLQRYTTRMRPGERQVSIHASFLSPKIHGRVFP